MVIIAGNWKMNKTIGEAISLVKELKKLVNDSDNEIIISPAFTALAAVSAELKGSNIKLCAQNMHFSNEGAFTGEISASMLKEIGVEYVILGHSERRHVFNEDNALINKKVKTALSNGLKPILCVGETLEEREKGRMKDVVVEQINKSLEGIEDKGLIVAYEPVWAIGTGKTATPIEAEEAHMFIRGLLGDDIPILYGGSVKPGNIKELIAQENIDGVLVGGASLDAKSFSEIVKC
jgi:triosephosphate isomerase